MSLPQAKYRKIKCKFLILEICTLLDKMEVKVEELYEENNQNNAVHYAHGILHPAG